jgi:hypothetical protein
MRFRWSVLEFGDVEWEAKINFSTNSGRTNPKDYFTALPLVESEMSPATLPDENLLVGSIKVYFLI